MPATDVLTQLRGLGVRVTVAGDGGKLSLEPASRIPPELLAVVREHKAELLAHLRTGATGVPQAEVSSGLAEPSEREYHEMAARVYREGVLLTWSTLLNDFVAFVRSEADLPKVPPGFVSYLDSEIKELWHQGKPSPTPGHLRLIHAAKKLAGARVTRPAAQEATIPPQPDVEGSPEAGSASNAS